MWAYLLSLTLPGAAALAVFYDHPAWYLLTIILIIPVLDVMIGREGLPVRNKIAESVVGYMPHCYTFIWWATLWLIGSKLETADAVNRVFLFITAGLISGFAAVHGHELMHRNCKHAQRAADWIFAIMGYPHYTILHHMHHAKPGDQIFGSAPKKGIGLWTHLPVSYENGFTCSWRAMARKGGLSPIRNRVIRQWLLALVVASACTYAWGMLGLAMYLIQAVIATLVIETAGYIQHYGYTREPREPVTQKDAWDADFWLSNRLLINNPYHAGHHLSPRSVFTELTVASKTLPVGYFTLLWVAMVPPLFRAIMDKHLALDRAETATIPPKK